MNDLWDFLIFQMVMSSPNWISGAVSTINIFNLFLYVSEHIESVSELIELNWNRWYNINMPNFDYVQNTLGWRLDFYSVHQPY